VPLLEGARALVAGNIPGGGRTNRTHFGPHVIVPATVEPALVDLLYDPQTSGGLLVSVDPSHLDALARAFAAAAVTAVRIGRALPRGDRRIVVL
jgi:selenide,water dikinase